MAGKRRVRPATYGLMAEFDNPSDAVAAARRVHEEGYTRIVSGNQKVEIYFQKGTPGVVAVTTWNRLLKTDKRIGPCSSVAALKRAYGARLKPFTRAKRIVAYRLGNLIFTVAPGGKLGVVALGRTVPSVYVALNAPACS